MFIHSSLYNEMGKSNGVMDAKGIIEFYLGIHILTKGQAVLCTCQTGISILMTDSAGISQFPVSGISPSFPSFTKF